MNKKNISRTLATLLFLLFTLLNAVRAQKLPNVQVVSLRAPANVKMDGKTNEWNDTFMAFNNKVILYYSMANDDDNLYLVIHSTNSIITNKILLGGIIFIVNATQKTEKGGISITYPVIGKNETEMRKQTVPRGTIQPINNEADREAIMNRRDSIMSIANSKFLNKLKLIQVSGIKEISDELISVYNEAGIKTGVFIGNHVYNYELAIPLKYLGVTASTAAVINYKIALPGDTRNRTLQPVVVVGSGPLLGEGGVDYRTALSTTDFWGTYTLIAK